MVILLVAVGALAWSLQLRPDLRVEASQLSTLPERLDGWQGSSIPLDETVESILRADANLQRIYRHALTGEIIWLYVGYYGTTRGGRPEHTPRGCYTGAGWAIVASRTLYMAQTDALRVSEYRVEREGEERLVHFWYRSHRRTGMIGGLDRNLDRLAGRLLDGRADGALIRVSTPLPDGDVVAARSRLQSFAAALDPQIAARWPEEHPASG
jgi:EpsI family protein